MALQELPTRNRRERERAWPPKVEAEPIDRAPVAAAGAGRWFVRQSLICAVFGLGGIAFFVSGMVLYLLLTLPDPAGSMG